MLREVMKLSALEHKKETGEISMDAFKRKQQQANKQSNDLRQGRKGADIQLPPVELKRVMAKDSSS